MLDSKAQARRMQNTRSMEQHVCKRTTLNTAGRLCEGDVLNDRGAEVPAIMNFAAMHKHCEQTSQAGMGCLVALQSQLSSTLLHRD